MSLRAELQGLSPLAVFGELPGRLVHLSDDTRAVRPGGGFVALQGSARDGHSLIGAAVQAGAAVVFCSQAWFAAGGRVDGAAWVVLDDTRLRLPALSRLVYGDPCRSLRVVGVTGTNGKTTTTYLLESLGRGLGKRVGVIGTVSHRYPGFSEASINTTPGVLKLAALLRDMVDARVEWLAMEVSSHGLAQDRVASMDFDVGVWTNLSQDHLDFHVSMEAYREAKKSLFSSYLASSSAKGRATWAVLNQDDAAISESFSAADAARWGQSLWFSTSADTAPVFGRALQVASGHQVDGTWSGHLRYGRQDFPFFLPLAGRFNLQNALGAVGACVALGEDPAAVTQVLGQVAQVPGRLQMLGGGGAAPRVYVDYAHTPEALVCALEALRESAPRRLWVVFGAGGDRDAGKRPLMGAAAARYADRVIITTDNPRSEAPEVIAAAIWDGVPAAGRGRSEVILERPEAVQAAVMQAAPEDVVLVAGKGHETYQIVGGRRLEMDDCALVAAALAERQAQRAKRGGAL